MDKQYKGWVVDFDGTLADKSFCISPIVKDAIRKLINAGYFFSMATGRPFQGLIKKNCQDLKLSSPQITSGGAQIFNPKTNIVLWAEYIPSDIAKALIDLFLRDKYIFSVENTEYVCLPDGPIMYGYGPDVTFKSLDKVDYHAISKMVLEMRDSDVPAEKTKELNKLFPNLHIVRSGVRRVVLDLTSEKATKHLAVLELSKILNIDPSLMIGIGDGYNDYPLLSACGYKIALENAPANVKEIADLIVPDVENNGFAIAVDKLL